MITVAIMGRIQARNTNSDTREAPRELMWKIRLSFLTSLPQPRRLAISMSLSNHEARTRIKLRGLIVNACMMSRLVARKAGDHR